jgi:hypothetical protein
MRKDEVYDEMVSTIFQESGKKTRRRNPGKGYIELSEDVVVNGDVYLPKGSLIKAVRR